MLECVDLFAGAGGISLGFRQSGIAVRLALDSSSKCAETYQYNLPGVTFCAQPIQSVTPKELLSKVKDKDRLVIAGGPPCQLFSRLNRRGSTMTSEILAYVNLVRKIRPLFVVLENVPAIMKRVEAWELITSTFRKMKYSVVHQIVRATDFGVPQSRERMIVVAGRDCAAIPVGTATTVMTVRDAIGHLPDVDRSITNHVGMNLSAENLKRIRKLRPGTNSRHRDEAFCDSYSRMHWDRPAPTITTKCISFSNGRFGHPEFNRALTIREAAYLQGFPGDFRFFGNLWECARQVGNAVPPPIAKSIGLELVRLAGGSGKAKVA